MRLKRQALNLTIALTLCAPAFSQPSGDSLRSFFEARLRYAQSTKPPSYEVLLRVIDSIKAESPENIRLSLPILRAAAASELPNLPVEAVFAYFEISRRPDGGVLLKNSAPELTLLLLASDERVRNGGVTVLRALSHAPASGILPKLTSMLSDGRYTALVKAEIFRSILESPLRSDAGIAEVLELYVESASDLVAQRDNLYAIAAGRYNTPRMIDYALKALGSPDEGVQIGAIQAMYAMGSNARGRARPVWERIATDPSGSQKLRFLAEKALKGTLSEPGKLPEPAPTPRLRGQP